MRISCEVELFNLIVKFFLKKIVHELPLPCIAMTVCLALKGLLRKKGFEIDFSLLTEIFCVMSAGNFMCYILFC